MTITTQTFEQPWVPESKPRKILHQGIKRDLSSYLTFLKYYDKLVRPVVHAETVKRLSNPTIK